MNIHSTRTDIGVTVQGDFFFSFLNLGFLQGLDNLQVLWNETTTKSDTNI